MPLPDSKNSFLKKLGNAIFGAVVSAGMATLGVAVLSMIPGIALSGLAMAAIIGGISGIGALQGAGVISLLRERPFAAQQPAPMVLLPESPQCAPQQEQLVELHPAKSETYHRDKVLASAKQALLSLDPSGMRPH